MQLVGIQIYNLDIVRIKNQRNEMQELLIIMEGSKIIFCPSKFAWAQERLSLTSVENLVTRPQNGSLALS